MHKHTNEIFTTQLWRWRDAHFWLPNFVLCSLFRCYWYIEQVVVFNDLEGWNTQHPNKQGIQLYAIVSSVRKNVHVVKVISPNEPNHQSKDTVEDLLTRKNDLSARTSSPAIHIITAIQWNMSSRTPHEVCKRTITNQVSRLHVGAKHHF